MKPALVLGLAFAAKAMTADNELGITQQVVQMPVDQIAFDEVTDNELRSFYELPRDAHGNLLRTPFATFDEVADDELAIAQQIINLPADYAFDDELAIKYVQLPVAEPVAFDEVADDELALPPVAKFDDVADDEFYAEEPQRENYATHKQWIRALVHYRIMGKDDAADDELAIAQQVINLPADHAFDDELAIKYVTLPTAEPVAFDDDEFVGFPQRDYYKSERVWYESLVKYQESLKKADDEELFYLPGYSGVPGQRIQDLVRDDEFLAVNQPQKPQKRPFEESKHAILCRNRPEHPFCGGPKRPMVKPTEADDEELYYVPGMRIQDIVHRDDVADDEFAIKYVHFPTAPAPEVLAYDEVADDELSTMPIHPKFTNIDWSKVKFPVTGPAVMPPIAYDDADDELFANGMRIQDIARDAEDDELIMIPHPMPFVHNLVRDDEADDELVYLGQLIKDGGYIPRPYFDDEFRAEKPGKSQEKPQKSEGPKNKRKFRPVVDEAPVYQN